MDNEIKKCSICNRDFIGWGNNAWPINDGRCCDLCNDFVVIPKRIENLYLNKNKENK